MLRLVGGDGGWVKRSLVAYSRFLTVCATVGIERRPFA